MKRTQRGKTGFTAEKLWGLLALAVFAIGLLTSCGGKTAEPTLGGESHFLSACPCSGGLKCLAGVCTRPCDTDAECRDLADNAACVESTDGPMCDVECGSSAECTELGGEFECRANVVCREVPRQNGNTTSAPRNQRTAEPDASVLEGEPDPDTEPNTVVEPDPDTEPNTVVEPESISTIPSGVGSLAAGPPDPSLVPESIPTIPSGVGGTSGTGGNESGPEPPLGPGPVGVESNDPTESVFDGCGENLLSPGFFDDSFTWIGGDPDSTDDNPCGIQGAFYAYGDENEALAAGLPPSCTLPEQSAEQSSCDDPGDVHEPSITCTDGRCCINGATIVDSNFDAWGCGIGFQLNSDLGCGVERPYSGLASGFDFRVEGFLSPGQNLRIQLKQPDNIDACTPYLQLSFGDEPFGEPITADTLMSDMNGGPGVFQGSVRFSGLFEALLNDEPTLMEVVCPTWCSECAEPTDTPMQIQFQVTGGNADGPFDICLSELIPIE